MLHGKLCIGFYLVGFLVELDFEHFTFEVFSVDLFQGNFYLIDLFGFFNLLVFGTDDVFELCDPIFPINIFVT